MTPAETGSLKAERGFVGVILRAVVDLHVIDIGDSLSDILSVQEIRSQDLTTPGVNVGALDLYIPCEEVDFVSHVNSIVVGCSRGSSTVMVGLKLVVESDFSGE